MLLVLGDSLIEFCCYCLRSAVDCVVVVVVVASGDSLLPYYCWLVSRPCFVDHCLQSAVDLLLLLPGRQDILASVVATNMNDDAFAYAQILVELCCCYCRCRLCFVVSWSESSYDVFVWAFQSGVQK